MQGNDDTLPSSRKRKHFKACLRCRRKKVRCPGGHPCIKCARNGEECQYDLEKKRFVSEAYVSRLEQGLSSLDRGEHTTLIAERGDSNSLQASELEDHIPNPLAHDSVNSTIDSIGGNRTYDVLSYLRIAEDS